MLEAKIQHPRFHIQLTVLYVISTVLAYCRGNLEQVNGALQNPAAVRDDFQTLNPIIIAVYRNNSPNTYSAVFATNIRIQLPLP